MSSHYVAHFLLLVVVVGSSLCFSVSDAFSVSEMQSRSKIQSSSSGSRLQASFHNDNDDKGDSLRSSEALLRQRICVRTLLTQRAVQSFMDLLISIRDPHTADWLQVRGVEGKCGRGYV